MPTNILYRGPDGATTLAGALEDFGQAVSKPAAEVDVASRKVCLENVSDRPLGKSPTFTNVLLHRVEVPGNDGITMVGFTAADPNGTLSKPWGDGTGAGGVPTGSPTVEDGGAGGVWPSTASRGVVVTATNAVGETIGSAEITVDVPDPTRKKRYRWKQVPGNTTGYNVYRTNTPGTYSPYTFVAHVSGAGVLTYLDDGAATGAGDPPSDNTTGATVYNLYGDPPSPASHTAADKVIATGGIGLAVGQQWFFWLDCKVPAGATSTGNKRVMNVIPQES